jgi:hypothetical protein
MLSLGTNRLKSAALAVSLLLCLSLAGVSAAPGMAAVAAQSRAGSSRTVVAHNGDGKAVSRIVGSTAGGRNVTGSFTPLHFMKRNGHVKVRGLLAGVVHKPGADPTFAALRTLRVKSVNGVPATNARQAARALATCDILHLVLAPLDLNLLGLKIHLDRVVLDIVAQTGAGNLLGNLLCAVTGLLDGGLGGALGRLVNLLNDILGRLGLGI